MCDVVWFRCEAAVFVGFLLRFDFQNHFNYSANTLFNMCAENHRVRALKKKTIHVRCEEFILAPPSTRKCLF